MFPEEVPASVVMTTAVSAHALSSCTVAWIVWDAEQNGSGADTIFINSLRRSQMGRSTLIAWLNA
jgi:hypothetical protein